MNQKDIIRRSNIADLLDDGIENSSDIRELVQNQGDSSGSASSRRVARSTTDPFEAQFSEITALDKIESKYLTKSLWRQAWFWYAFPPIVVLITGAIALFYHPIRINSIVDFLVASVLVASILLLVSYWPFVLVRRANRRFWDDR